MAEKSRNLKILFIGDIVGRIGRRAVAKILPPLKRSRKIDLVVANAENIAHGSGISEKTIEELSQAGIDNFTSGDHAFKNAAQLETYEKLGVLRPANLPARVPGKGHDIIKIGDSSILLINLIGQVGMKMDYNSPFHKLDEILANKDLRKKNYSAIIIDIHGETTSEKIAFGHYADDRVTAVLGTHTHIMTADAHITANGMAYITDVGMTGLADGCLGTDKENILKTFLTQVKYPHVIPETGRAIFNAVELEIDPETAKALSVRPITKFVNIK